MFRLIGEIVHVEQDKIGGSFEAHFETQVIALFSSYEKASDYITNSRLKKVKRSTYSGTRAFHSRSLLGRCCDAWISEDNHDSFEIDPKF